MRIEIWSDVVCPWCYIGKRRLEAALRDFPHADEVEVVFRSFELDPAAPRGGTEKVGAALARKYSLTPEQTEAAMARVAAVAEEVGLRFAYDDAPHTRTVDAHRLLHLALAEGGPSLQRTLKEALLAAYFEHGRDVGDAEVLGEVATGIGLPAERVTEVLRTGEYAEQVAADVAQARSYGATGVPFFVVDGRYGVSGAQPTELFSQLLERAWAESRPTLIQVGDGRECGPDGCPL